MLSRSNSNAADRLRRAKSVSSAHTSSSGHQRTTTSIDPLILRQNAEAAAVEAYQRAQFQVEPSVQSKLQRRRSQAGGRSEGSHFEDARLGRRRSTALRDGGGKTQAARQRRSGTNVPETVNIVEGDRIITRRRSVIPPATENMAPVHAVYSLVSSTKADLRKKRSDDHDGSPTPRHSISLKQAASNLKLRTSTDGSKIRNEGKPAHRQDFYNSSAGACHDSQAQNFPTIEPHISDGRPLSEARGVSNPDPKQIKQRKSFLFRSFPKRQFTPSKSGVNFDNSLPPFNYAYDGFDVPIVSEQPLEVTPVHKPERRVRNFSDSLKGCLRKAFRRASKAPVGLPSQHIEAKDFHFTVANLDRTGDTASSLDYGDPFKTMIASEQAQESVKGRFGTTHSYNSTGEDSTSKSRVTSWTNSTAAGMSSVSTSDGLYPAEDDNIASKSFNGRAKLRKASSFFGRPINNKLQRAIKADLRNSGDSEALYLALQQRIQPADRSTVSNDEAITENYVSYRRSSALDTLPSQSQDNLRAASARNTTSATIRTVTPELAVGRREKLTPVNELSRSAVETFPENSLPTPNIDTPQGLRRRPATRAPAPSQEQIVQRMERSKNRWRTQLAGHPSYSSDTPGYTLTEDNTYELKSLRGRGQELTTMDDLPHHAKIRGDAPRSPVKMQSPSIYSRATDGASPRLDTPEDQGMTMITVTGREVRRYDISPPKTARNDPRPIQASREFRRWLSDEMSRIGSEKNKIVFPQSIYEPSTLQDDSRGEISGLQADYSLEADVTRHSYGRESASPST